jgi:hypothetical protein
MRTSRVRPLVLSPWAPEFPTVPLVLHLITNPFWGCSSAIHTGRLLQARDRFDSDYVVGTQFESSRSTTQSHTNRDFPVSRKWRRIGGFSCGGFVSANDRLNVTDLFDAAVSAP